MSQELHILILEDRPVDVELATHELRVAGFRFTTQWVMTEPDFRAGLRVPELDLILADYSLPGYDGRSALALARKERPELPFIFVSGSMGEETAIDALHHGATDYVLKEKLSRLGPAVRRALREREASRERDQAEAALRLAEEKYRGIFEHAAEGIFQSTPDGRLLTVNPAFAAIHGYDSPAECVAAVQDIARQFYVDPARRDVFRRELEERGKVVNFENQVFRKDGSVMWVSTSARVIRDSRGTVLRYEGFVEDITERKRAESRIQHLNQLLRAIRDINLLVVRERDPKQLLAEACKILVRARGYRLVWIGQPEPGSKRVLPVAQAGDEADYLGQVTLTWDEQASGQGPVGTAMRTGCPNWVQNTATDPRFAPWREAALARGYASVAAVPLLEGNTVLGALVVYSGQKNAFDERELGLLKELAGDLAFALQHIETERQRMEGEGRLHLQSAALESAANGIVIADREGAIIWANPAFTRMTGYSLEEAAGLNPRLLKSGLQDEAFYQQLWETILDGRVWHGELRNKRKDGSLYDEEMTIAPVKDVQGQVIHFVAIKQDITEKKALEKRMLRAQRMESIGQLAGGIAHDLNNVLAPIRMSVDLLRPEVTSPASQKTLEILRASAERGAAIVKQVLTFARGVEGERVPLQSRHLVKELTKLMHETFPKDIQIKFNLPKDLWLVRGDATQIHQVLMNLCVNARDAMPNGGVLRLTAQNQAVDESLASMIPEARPGNYVALTVADTGTGMTLAVLDRIFEPFYTTKEIGKGSGLGLPTVLGIVRSHAGFVQVASEVGRGSQFTVFLPAASAAEAAAAALEAAAPGGHGECVLLVDDEKMIRDVISRLLTLNGYQVVVAADGAEGVARFVEHRDKIAVVLSDLMMPVMDGAAMIRSIRKLDPSSRVLVSTGLMVGSEMEPKVEELKGMGITGFLQKPYNNRVLLEAIHDALHPAA